MVLGKRIQVSAPKFPASIGPLKVMTLPMASRPTGCGEIAVAANQQRVRCWRAISPASRYAAAGDWRRSRRAPPARSGCGRQLGQLVDIGQAFMFSSGETLLPAGNDLLVGHLCPASCRR
jgi:hypothetical protein